MSRARQSSSSVASASPKRRLLATVPPNRNAFWGIDADPRPEVLAVHLPDVDAVDEDRARRRVVEPRDQVDEGALAAAGAADDRGRLPGSARNEMSWRTGSWAPGIAELDVAELDDAALRAGRIRDDGFVRIVDRGRGVEDLVDPPRRHRRAGDQDEHEDRGQGGEEDLGQVLQERREVADRELPVLDADGAEPEGRDGREVEDREDHGWVMAKAGLPGAGRRRGRGSRSRTWPPRGASGRRPG